MDKILDCVCRLLPNKIKVSVASVQNDIIYNVTGITNLDKEIPTVVCKKDTDATYHVPVNLINKIIVESFNNENNENN